MRLDPNLLCQDCGSHSLFDSGARDSFTSISLHPVSSPEPCSAPTSQLKHKTTRAIEHRCNLQAISRCGLCSQDSRVCPSNRSRQTPVAIGCVHCKKKHLRCDSAKLCGRCVQSGKRVSISCPCQQEVCKLTDVEHLQRLSASQARSSANHATSRKARVAGLRFLRATAIDALQKNPPGFTSQHKYHLFLRKAPMVYTAALASSLQRKPDLAGVLVLERARPSPWALWCGTAFRLGMRSSWSF